MAGVIYKTENGRPHPLGATVEKMGVNFSLFSEHATSVELLLFDRHNDIEPKQIISFDPNENKTFHVWHIFVKGLKPGIHYAFRVDGPSDLKKGQFFNKNKVLLDPYARGNNKLLWNYQMSCNSEDNIAHSIRSTVIDTSNYDWEGDKPLKRPMNNTIIYELHVRGFTKSKSSKVKHPGTFLGLIEKIPYLQELGVTAVELLPIFGFDEMSELPYAPGSNLSNFWGYNTVSFFSPNSDYCVTPNEGTHVNEFRDMVKALHKAGIEVILDIVFNHTYEGNENGPVISFKGIDNTIYYLIDDDGNYLDFTGCGNSFNCNHPIVSKFIIDCLRYWVTVMHIDGFRFDEASVLSRGEDGEPMKYPPILWAIELSEFLLDTKVIAEAWDAGGLYQVGYFPGYRWAEWNGKFRDEVRRFVIGEAGIIKNVAFKIIGSEDLYKPSERLPINSINFITAHDGFTMNDLVSYNDKHNMDNGEDGKDGANQNFSWNCGEEGPSQDLEIEQLRDRLIKNYTVILLLSQGVPMILGGDEVRRTQQGNNNAYCQDNEISWFDWDLPNKNSSMFRFWKKMITFRKRHPALHRRRFFSGSVNGRGLKDISWHGVNLNEPNWDDENARALAFTLGGEEKEADIHVMMNMYWESLNFEIPPVDSRKWYLVANTFLASPDDIVEAGYEKVVDSSTYQVRERSVVMLISK
jgi:isoamylase